MGKVMKVWLIKASDGRYVTKFDIWTGSPKVLFELGDRADAVMYLVRRRADDDAQLLNGMKTFRRVRNAVVRRHGELSFTVEEAGCIRR